LALVDAGNEQLVTDEGQRQLAHQFS